MKNNNLLKQIKRLINLLENDKFINSIYNVPSIIDKENILNSVINENIDNTIDFILKKLISMAKFYHHKDKQAELLDVDLFKEGNYKEAAKYCIERIIEVLFLYKDFNIIKKDPSIDNLYRTNKKELLYLLIELLTLVNLTTLYEVKEEFNNKDFIEEMKSNDNNPYKEVLDGLQQTFYRGQTDYNYDLLPSIYRGLKLNNSNENSYISINKDVLFNLYKTSKLIDKYNLTFIDKNKITTTKDLDYNFMAFMQHSSCYSPFLDLSSKKEISLSFACNKYKNDKDYNFKDSSLYEFFYAGNKVYKNIKEINKEIDNINIKVFPNKLNITSKINNNMYLYQIDPDEFDYKYIIINLPTNDRMKYQKGLFMLITKGIFVNNKLLRPYFSDFRITKYKINKSDKKNIYNLIKRRYRYYTYNHLMDPYSFFDK